jgi:alkylation response protein AidB-like acyl-CoA dehydrogenase
MSVAPTQRFSGFVAERVNPGAEGRDRRCEPFPRELIAEGGALGLLATTLPAELGGQALDARGTGEHLRALAGAAEELAFPFFLSYQQSITRQLHALGRADLFDLCRALARGQKTASFCWSEGADAFSFKTVVRRDGRLVLDGAKGPITGGLFSDVFVVYARDEERQDLVAVLVERTDPGVEVVPMDPMGLRALGQAEVRFRGVELDERRLLVPVDALSHAQAFLNTRRIAIPSFVLGRLETFFDAIVSDLEGRVRYRTPVVEMQAVQATLGRMWASIEACRASVDRMWGGLAAPASLAWNPSVAATKYMVVEAMDDFIRDAQRLLGGRWYFDRWPYGRWMRDLLGLIPAAGTQAILEVDLGVLAAHDAHIRRRGGPPK